MTIQLATYDKFKMIEFNREVSEKHKNKLIESMKENGFMVACPVIVDKKMRVIDGQHRIHAARDLGIEIPYIVQEDATDDHIIAYNSLSKRWTLEDYILFYAKKGSRPYTLLKQFAEANGYKYSMALTVLLGTVIGTGNSRYIKMGKLKVSYDDLEAGAERARNISQISAICGLRGDKFVRALVCMMRNPRYDHAHFLSRLSFLGKKIKRVGSSFEYLAQLSKAYNYLLPEGEAVLFTATEE